MCATLLSVSCLTASALLMAPQLLELKEESWRLATCLWWSPSHLMALLMMKMCESMTSSSTPSDSILMAVLQKQHTLFLTNTQITLLCRCVCLLYHNMCAMTPTLSLRSFTGRVMRLACSPSPTMRTPSTGQRAAMTTGWLRWQETGSLLRDLQISLTELLLESEHPILELEATSSSTWWPISSLLMIPQSLLLLVGFPCGHTPFTSGMF